MLSLLRAAHTLTTLATQAMQLLSRGTGGFVICGELMKGFSDYHYNEAYRDEGGYICPAQVPPSHQRLSMVNFLRLPMVVFSEPSPSVALGRCSSDIPISTWPEDELTMGTGWYGMGDIKS